MAARSQRMRSARSTTPPDCATLCQQLEDAKIAYANAVIALADAEAAEKSAYDAMLAAQAAVDDANCTC